MFSTKWPVRATCFGALMFVAGAALSEESHLTLDDIDKLAREKLVDSMRKGQGGEGNAAPASGGVGLSSPLGAAPAPVAAAPAPVAPKIERQPSLPPKRMFPATFVGAYSDVSGSYVLYDYQGTTYAARRGTRLLNGWTVASIDGFSVNLVDGKRHWTETIAAPADVPVISDGPAVRAITDLSSPLPPGGVSSTASTFVPFGK